MTAGSSFLRRRAFCLGALAVVAAAPVRADRTNVCDFSEFGPDPTGATPCDAQFQAWLAAALGRGQVAYAGPGLFRLAATQIVPLDAVGLEIAGAGIGRTTFRRMAHTIARNGDTMIRFLGGNGASVSVSGLTLDGDCDNQPLPPGEGMLAYNFAWQHCMLMEFIPGAGGFGRIHAADCEVRNPMSDGFSIRGGETAVPAVREALFERIVNTAWRLDRVRPRVRGDITITAYVAHAEVRDCVLPRLHYEPKFLVPEGQTMTIFESNNRVGELLAHMEGSGRAPDRTRRVVTGGSIDFYLMQGEADTRYTGTRITPRRPGNRLTGGHHRFERCAFQIAPEYRTAPGETALLSSSYPAAGAIEIVDCSLTADPAAKPPGLFISRRSQGSGGGAIVIDGLRCRAPAMQLVLIDTMRTTIRDVTSDYRGGGGQGGAFILLGSPALPGDYAVSISGVRLPDARATLFRGSPSARVPAAGVVAVTLAGNRVAGRLVDDQSAGFGAIAARMGEGVAASWRLSGDR